MRDSDFVRKVAKHGRLNPLYDAGRLHAIADRLEQLEQQNDDLQQAVYLAIQFMAEHSELIGDLMEEEAAKAQQLLSALKLATTPDAKPMPVTDLEMSVPFGQIQPDTKVQEARRIPANVVDADSDDTPTDAAALAPRVVDADPPQPSTPSLLWQDASEPEQPWRRLPAQYYRFDNELVDQLVFWTRYDAARQKRMPRQLYWDGVTLEAYGHATLLVDADSAREEDTDNADGATEADGANKR